MNATNACPSREAFAALAEGQLTAQEWETLAQHLESCPDCLAALARLPHLPVESVLRGTTQPLVAPPAGLLQRLKAAGRDHSTHNTAADRTGDFVGDFDWKAALAPARQPDEIGRLAGFRILRELGRGGMGVVVLAEDEQLRRPVALKLMHPKYVADPTARERFLREARGAAGLHHERIVTVHSVGEDRSVPYLVMEYLTGESLADRIGRGRMPLVEVLRVAREMAQGLEAAHGRGLIHRDIKPSNVWLEGESGRVKLLDFGLVRGTADPDLTSENAIVGTPAYMSPEQARSQPLDARSDLFSLGVVLYEMLTGRKPFVAADTFSTLMLVATQAPTAPSELDDSIPQQLSAFTLSLLARDPAQRPSTAAEVVRSLESFELVPHRTKARPRLPRVLAGVTLAVSLLGLVLWAAQVIRITDRDGNTVAEIPLPKDGKVEVVKDSKATPIPIPETKKNDPKAAALVVPLDFPPEPLPALKGREPFSPLALVQRPAELRGVRRWTIETAAPPTERLQFALSPDGKWLAGWLEREMTIRIWNARTLDLERVLVIESPIDWHTPPHWLPDSTRLVVPQYARPPVIWDALAGKIVRRFTVEGQQSGRLSADGTLLECSVTRPGGQSSVGLVLIDVQTGQAREPEKDGALGTWGLAGRVMIKRGPNGDWEIRRYEASGEFTRKAIPKTIAERLEDAFTRKNNETFSADGRYLVTRKTTTDPVALWDLQTDTLVRQWDTAVDAFFVHQGSRLVVRFEERIPNPPRLRTILRVYEDLAELKNESILTISGDMKSGGQTIFLSPDLQTIWTTARTGAVSGGRYPFLLAVDRQGTVLRTLDCRPRHEPPLDSSPSRVPQWSSTGNELSGLLTSRSLAIWNGDTGERLRSLPVPHPAQSIRVDNAWLNPTDDTLWHFPGSMLGGQTLSTRLATGEAGPRTRFAAHPQGFDSSLWPNREAFRWSPTGEPTLHRRLILQHSPSRYSIVDFDYTTKEVRERRIPDDLGRVDVSKHSAALSPDGNLVYLRLRVDTLSGPKRKLVILDAETLREEYSEMIPGGASTRAIPAAFSPDSQTLAWVIDTGKMNDPTQLVLWDRKTGKTRSAPLINCRLGVGSPVWVPDGRHIFVPCNTDDSQRNLFEFAQVWQVEPLKAVREIPAIQFLEDRYDAMFSPDGKIFRTRQGTYYDTLTGEPILAWVTYQKDDKDIAELQVSAEGHYRCTDPTLEADLRYVVELTDGTQHAFTAAEFAAKFGWKNDPAKVRLRPKQ